MKGKFKKKNKEKIEKKICLNWDNLCIQKRRDFIDMKR